jgi:hypothetical protein
MTFVNFFAIVVSFFLHLRIKVAVAFIILIFELVVLTPFATIVASDQVFVPESALSRACANPFNSAGLLIYVIFLPACEYILLGLTELILTGNIKKWGKHKR